MNEREKKGGWMSRNAAESKVSILIVLYGPDCKLKIHASCCHTNIMSPLIFYGPFYFPSHMIYYINFMCFIMSPSSLYHKYVSKQQASRKAIPYFVMRLLDGSRLRLMLLLLLRRYEETNNFLHVYMTCWWWVQTTIHFIRW